MIPASLSIGTEGSFARALTDIGYVLAFAEQPEARIQRALGLLREMVTCQHSAILIDAPPRPELFMTAPESHAASEGVRQRLRQFLQTINERPPRGGGDEPYRLQERSVGRSSLAVPLVAVDAIVGILSVEREDGEYTVRELRLLSLVASQFAAYVRGLQFLEQAEHARDKAEESSKGKDRFLATLSHELRTPLNVIQGYLQMLRSGSASEADTHKAITVIERNVAVQARLVDELLDAARIATGKFHMEVQDLEIVSVIGTTVDGVRPSAALKGVELEWVAPSPRDWRVEGDPERLQRAIANLLVNAVKFTPAGGRVRVNAERLGSQLQIQIRDTGIGIASEHLQKIVEPFWQADGALIREEGGLGLGLSIVHHIVLRHRGEMLIESDGPGRGTSVTVRLPLTAP